LTVRLVLATIIVTCMDSPLITFVDPELPPAEAQLGDTFSRFAEMPFYAAVNRSLAERAAAERLLGKTIIEIASGTGGFTQGLIEVWAKPQGAKILAIEPSRSAVEAAIRRLDAAGFASPDLVEFLVAPASQLGKAVSARGATGEIDSVFLCNAIHLLDDAAKRAVLREIREVLKPGGVLALNSTFFDGAAPAHTQGFFKAWMMTCVRDLRKAGVSLEKSKVAARRQLDAPEIEAMLAETGFVKVITWLDEVEIPAEGLEAISEYLSFASGALPGIPDDLAVETLRRNVAPAMAAQGLKTVTRNWLQVLAQAG
jgi:ubiquinone/menaquinone biosynthesis C-methylase UbiE